MHFHCSSDVADGLTLSSTAVHSSNHALPHHGALRWIDVSSHDKGATSAIDETHRTRPHGLTFTLTLTFILPAILTHTLNPGPLLDLVLESHGHPAVRDGGAALRAACTSVCKSFHSGCLYSCGGYDLQWLASALVGCELPYVPPPLPLHSFHIIN